MSVNLTEQLRSCGRQPFRAAFRFLFQLEQRLLRERWSAPRAMERLLVAITAATDKWSTRDLTLRASLWKRWRKPPLLDVGLLMLFMLPLDTGCSLHWSSVSCVLKAQLDDKENPPTISVSSRRRSDAYVSPRHNDQLAEHSAALWFC